MQSPFELASVFILLKEQNWECEARIPDNNTIIVWVALRLGRPLKTLAQIIFTSAFGDWNYQPSY